MSMRDCLVAGFIILGQVLVMTLMFTMGMVYHGANCLSAALGSGKWEHKTFLGVEYISCER